MFILSFAEDFWSVVYSMLIGIGTLIYAIISNVYQVFIAISSARIFTVDQYQSVANNVYIVIGVASLFFIAYGLLQAIINPDNAGGKSDQSVGNIVKNIVLSIVLIAFVPAIFNFAFALQDTIISGNILQNIIFHNNSGSNSFDIKTVGNTLANETFIISFVPVDDNGEPLCMGGNIDVSGTDVDTGFMECLNSIQSDKGNGLGDIYSDVSKSGDFSKYKQFSSNVYDDQIKVNFIILYFVGIFMVYIFVSFCFDMGVRAVKLAYYQIIAPLPILTLVIPGQKKVFENWRKSSLSTYAEVFLRLFIVYFVLFLIKNLPSLDDSIWSESLIQDPSGGVKIFAKIFIILGLLLFMKQAPKLLGDMFGIQSGSFKLGIRDKLKEATDFTKVPVIGKAQTAVNNGFNKVKGAATGALGAGWSAKVNGVGFKQGAKYGMANGWKNGGNQFNAQRQGIYSKAFQGEGTAGWFGKRAFIDQKTADINKATKNAYKSENFNRVLGFEKSPEWKSEYQKSYNDIVSKLNNSINQIKAKIVIEEDSYNKQESELNNKIVLAKKNKEDLNKAQLAFENERQNFEVSKNTQRQLIQKEYDDAVKRKDISAQLDAQKRLNDLDKQVYHNSALENKIKDLKTKDVDVASLEAQLNQVKLQRKNDSTIDAYNNQLEEYNKHLANINEEKDYITGSGKYAGVTRTYNTEKEFAKEHGGFTEVVKGASATYKTTHPEYKDVYDTHNKYLSEEAVSQYINSEEGQKAIAVRERAERNIQSGAAPSKPKDEKKS